MSDDSEMMFIQRADPERPTDLPDDKARCNLCGDMWPRQDFTLAQALKHIRLFHPEHYGDGPERWPDGSLVVVDESLSPDDFGVDGNTDA